jgi:indolepyruvate ferredoxin oxidoreductase beta subunit
MVKLNVLIAGVGGQGVVLASDILADVALEAGLDVKKTDTLGMAQRGGSVVTQVRIGENVASPLIGANDVDLLLAFEKLESVRWADYLKEGATVVLNDYSAPPLSVSQGAEPYPGDSELIHLLKHRGADVIVIQGSLHAAEMGNPKILNILMLGALSMLTPFNPELWTEAISKRLPAKIADINLMAFKRGRKDLLSILAEMPGEAGREMESHGDDCGCH